jgi:hypothetical protein
MALNVDHSPMTTSPKTLPTDALVIRMAGSDDTSDLERLAQLDDQRPLRGNVLVAECNGELLAARAVVGGRTIADPFHHTKHLAALLEVRAELMRGPSSQMVRGPSMLDRARHAIAA